MSNLWGGFEQNVGGYCQHVTPGELDYATNISLKYNYLYVETPKVGCSTIKKTLQKLELGNPKYYHPDFDDIHKRNFSPLLKPSQVFDLKEFISLNKPFVFCFVRNPYSRLLSAYLDKIQGRSWREKRTVLAHLGRDISDLDQSVSFADFVQVVIEQPIANMDLHWRTQYYQTCQRALVYNFVGRIESFAHDFNYVLDKVGAEGDVYLDQKINNTEADLKLFNHYTPELVSLVQKKFAIDFEYFGYSTNPYWYE